jgi:hypothetical protein
MAMSEKIIQHLNVFDEAKWAERTNEDAGYEEPKDHRLLENVCKCTYC